MNQVNMFNQTKQAKEKKEFNLAGGFNLLKVQKTYQ
jgi:hypothetical protein